jgi:hypothetical protein
MIEFDASAATSAHKHWKSRLSLLVGDLQKEPLDPIEVGDAMRCELEKWIATMIDNNRRDSLFTSLITTHTEFHRLASVIVSLANNGEREEAKRLLDNEFAELSADVVDLLNVISFLADHNRPSCSC